MFNFLRKKIIGDRFSNLNNSLTLTFSNLKQDVVLIKQWIAHLNERSKEIDSFKEHLTLTKDDVKSLNLWIEYLERRHNELHSYVYDLHKNDKEIFERLKKLEEIKENLEKTVQGQVGTLQGTSQGQVGDKSIEEVPKEMKVKEPKKFSILDKEAFTGAETEVLNVLYHSDRPMNYGRISKIVGKKEKSIRNLIYEIRRKGIDILTKPIGIRQKGFYLPPEEKIKVSGR